jgi:cyclomaltodextrinase / maltogenic alpha-amylase / neopullulanase
MFPAFAKNLTIYEVNLRQYSESGSIREFVKHIPRLKSMGIGILWIMPVHPIGSMNKKGELGSYYSVRDYFSIDPTYGSINDFKNLVQAVHEHEMFIILDWVANHTAWDNPLTITHPEYYKRDEQAKFTPPFPEWEDVIKLDFDNLDVWRYMTQAMQFWVEETNIDGFRCDMANLVPTIFWKEAIRTIRNSKKLFMLAEAEDRQLLENGFDAIYNWDIFHLFNQFIQGKDNADKLDQKLASNFLHFPGEYSQMLFTSNHDENSWNGSAIERLGSALEATTVLTFTLPGIPLIYSGQEAGNPKRLSFFNKDLIAWKDDKMAVLYQKLCMLRKNNMALWSNPYGGIFRRITNSLNYQVFSFIREKENHKIVVMINLSWDTSSFSINTYKVEGEYLDVLSGKTVFVVPGAQWTLDPWKFLILVK